MVSVELKEAESTALHYAEKYFDGNVSKFLRQATINFDKNQKKHQTTTIFQIIAFLLISICFILLAVSLVIDLIAVILPSILSLCSIFLLIYAYIVYKENKKVRGGRVWTS